MGTGKGLFQFYNAPADIAAYRNSSPILSRLSPSSVFYAGSTAEWISAAGTRA
jgi:hypothetical protein